MTDPEPRGVVAAMLAVATGYVLAVGGEAETASEAEGGAKGRDDATGVARLPADRRPCPCSPARRSGVPRGPNGAWSASSAKDWRR